MRLKSIKLAGFKSFALPTEIKLKGNMTGVVGPNGCGKSNILDAVRWVLGESQAKYLRGDSMADVVFNGSSARKPVSCASIELIFDNSDGKLNGAYANYAEVSLKRMVCRDGQSNYFLNNTKCRKKDITDLFLGTGLSARSYAIIEQGMISRIIESKPDELRQYLEEAANISHYKSRKKETLARLKSADENLTRLADIKAELNRNLEKLREQAQAAKKYQALSAEKRHLMALHLGLKWQDYQKKIKQLNATILDLDAAIIKEESLQAKNLAEIEELEAMILELEDLQNTQQEQYFSMKNQLEINKQNIVHKSKRHSQLLGDLEDIKTQELDLQELKDEETHKSKTYELDYENLQQNLQDLSAKVIQLGTELEQQEEQMQKATGAWRQAHIDSSAIETELLRARDKQSQKQQEKQASEQKIEKLINSLAQISNANEYQQLDIWREEAEELEEQKAELNLTQEDTEAEISNIKQEIIQAETVQSELNARHIEVKNKLAALEAVLQEDFDDATDFSDWLQERGWQDSKTLADVIQVEKDWQKALELVLQDRLKARLLNLNNDNLIQITDLPVAKFSAIQAGDLQTGNFIQHDKKSLANFVQAPFTILNLLKNIFVCENLAEAIDIRANLQDGESLITKSGFWLAKDWFLARGDISELGFLSKKQDFENYSSELEALEENLIEVKRNLQDLKLDLQEREGLNQELVNAQKALLQKLGNLQSSIAGIEAQKNATQNNIETQNAQIDELNEFLEEVSEELLELEDKIAELDLLVNSKETNADSADAEQKETLEKIQLARKNYTQELSQQKELELEIKGNRVALSASLESIERFEKQALQLANKKQTLQEQLQELDFIDENSDEIEELEAEVNQAHTQLEFTKMNLQESKQNLKTVEANSRSSDKRHKTFSEQKIQLVANNTNLQEQQKQILEELVKEGFELESLLDETREDLSLETCLKELEQVNYEIEQLGGVNLAAITQLAEEEQRLEFYIQQEEELLQAVAALNQAIEKLDFETQKRFNNTFNAINQKLGIIFPKIFGGGSAWLEKVNSEEAEPGVSIMARPGGKKNSSIHLLSGGEKALTALALIFAIFELNPSPFCLLDEVDAPLDEANVIRYANLVKDMSQQIQFIFITHNKATMQRAENLLGVTMQEAGVSRIVSVDLAEAESYLNA